jgi:hypothetical protein
MTSRQKRHNIDLIPITTYLLRFTCDVIKANDNQVMVATVQLRDDYVPSSNLYPLNRDMNHRLWDIILTKRDIFRM